MPQETALARQAIREYLLNNNVIKTPAKISDNLIQHKAGVFVSLHQNQELRGCIGTILPTQDNIALEIIQNALSAATKDHRFLPLKLSELSNTHISVDILSEPILAKKSELDPKKYGVVVKLGGLTGLLLPDLDGIVTVDEQLKIACQKANIDPQNNSYKIYKFTVKRISE